MTQFLGTVRHGLLKCLFGIFAGLVTLCSYATQLQSTQLQSTQLQYNQLPSNQPVTIERKLTFIVGIDKAPYIHIASSSGYELELLKLLAKQLGYSARFVHVPNGRLLDTFQDGIGDIVTLQPQAIAPYFRTKPYIYYENVVIVAPQYSQRVNKIADLAGLRVQAFQNAHQYLGEAYRAAIPTFASYHEVVEQQYLPDLLYKKRLDALVMDRFIFQHYCHHCHDPQWRYAVKPLFAHNPYHLLARNETTANALDKALLHLEKTGQIKELQQRFFSAPTQKPQSPELGQNTELK
jgi:polar amino acid transport system substrate-binding protein